MSKVYVVQIYSEDTEGNAILSICDSAEIAKEHIYLFKNSIIDKFENEGYSCKVEKDEDNDWHIWMVLEKEDMTMNIEIFCIEFTLNSTSPGQILEVNCIHHQEENK